MFLPASLCKTLYLADVAPAIGVPSLSHWYVRDSGTGAHVPEVAVSVFPASAVPVTVGTGVAMKLSRVANGSPSGTRARAMAGIPARCEEAGRSLAGSVSAVTLVVRARA